MNFIYTVLRILILPLVIFNLLPNYSFICKDAASAVKFDYDNNLQADADALLPLFDNMPPVPVYLKDEPTLKSGTSTESGVAYTNCENHENPSIFIKQIFYQKTNRVQLVNILKHELTHSWLCRQHLMAGHDANFHQKFKQVGGWGN